MYSLFYTITFLLLNIIIWVFLFLLLALPEELL